MNAVTIRTEILLFKFHFELFFKKSMTLYLEAAFGNRSPELNSSVFHIIDEDIKISAPSCQ